MDDQECQAEHDANVAAIKVALARRSKAELLHSAATQIVNAMYAEASTGAADASVRQAIAVMGRTQVAPSSIAFAAGMNFGATAAVHLMMNGMPELKAMTRAQSAKHAAVLRHTADPKQRAKALIEAEWKTRRSTEGKGRWFSKFAEAMIVKYPAIAEEKTIRKWISEWEKQHSKI